jgi:glucose/arabinose dehydrogenase
MTVILRRLLITLLLFYVGTATAWAQTDLTIRASRLASRLPRPIFLTSAPGDADRLFVLEQHTGRIKILDQESGAIRPEPFLDLNNLSTGGEQGLLGIAFDPNYDESGQFYVNFTDRGGRTNVVRYQVSDDPDIANPESATTILQVNQPQGNHNAGWMSFGPQDGYLYVAMGDGGGADDNGNGHTPGVGNSQDITNNLLGAMLRIDVSGDDFPQDENRNYAIPATNPFVGMEGDDEIWSYGLRNPWRNSFDRETGDLWIADVGQNRREEINRQPADSTGGENYGWRLREGFIATPGVGGPAPADHVEPVYDYPHNNSDLGGFSVTGGYVYRGPIEALRGHYFFADFVTNRIWSFQYDTESNQIADFQDRTDQIQTDAGTIDGITSFGEDALGNLYIVTIGGDVFRLDGVDVPGDLNGNGVLDAGDIDRLTQAVVQGETASSFDLNSDGLVNPADRLFWIHEIKQTWLGDSNLDGLFDESDLVFTFQAGEYEDGVPQNSSWSTGDWDGDQDFGTADLVAAFQDGGYRAGPRSAVQAVPEPSSLAMWVVAALSLVVRVRGSRENGDVRISR